MQSVTSNAVKIALKSALLIPKSVISAIDTKDLLKKIVQHALSHGLLEVTDGAAFCKVIWENHSYGYSILMTEDNLVSVNYLGLGFYIWGTYFIDTQNIDVWILNGTPL